MKEVRKLENWKIWSVGMFLFVVVLLLDLPNELKISVIVIGLIFMLIGWFNIKERIPSVAR